MAGEIGYAQGQSTAINKAKDLHHAQHRLDKRIVVCVDRIGGTRHAEQETAAQAQGKKLVHNGHYVTTDARP